MSGRSPWRPRAGVRTLRRTASQTAIRRMRWLLAIYGLVFALAIAQLVNIQVVNAQEYAEVGVRQRERIIELPATRGRIYDREGDVLATSVAGATVYADPRVYQPRTTPDGLTVRISPGPAEVAATLAPLLGRAEEDLLERLQRDTHFVYLGRQLDWEVGEQIRELALPGINVVTEPRRVYPAAGLASHVVGFTGIDGDGLQGLEARYDDLLRGTPGSLFIERTPGGLAIASGARELVSAQPGTDLVLTLDREIQHAAERAAMDVIGETGARGASVVVLDVPTGEVLAMASAPTYDPHRRTEEDRDAWRNRAVTDVFEPGSTQKALTIAAAVEERLVRAGTMYSVADQLQVSTHTFSDSSPHPVENWTVAEIVERSSNVGTIQIAQELGAARLDEYLRAFGYGTSSGIGFPGESPGLLPSHERWSGTSLPTVAIGYGVAVTLMQLAAAYATLANDGVAVPSRLVRGTVGEDGRLSPLPPAENTRVVSSATAREMRTMLERVVAGPNGTGARAQVAGYSVAGKTGTARKPNEGRPGYSDQYVASFVGFAPVEDPRIVVAVMVDEPWPIYGGLVAAPVFSEVMEVALTARRVPPDRVGHSLTEVIDRARDTLVDDEAGGDTAAPAAGAAGSELAAGAAGSELAAGVAGSELAAGAAGGAPPAAGGDAGP